MIVIITNTKDVHTDAVEVWLNEWKVPYFRFHPDELVTRYTLQYQVSTSSYSYEIVDSCSGKSCLPEQVKVVWFRRPLTPQVHENSSDDAKQYFVDEISAFLASFYVATQHAYWVNPLATMGFANDKLAQLRVAKSLGFRLPQTLVTNEPKVAYDFYSMLNFECIVKPFRPTLVRNNERVFTHKFESGLSLSDFLPVEAAPTVLQEFIDKKSDLRITIVGKDIFACRIFSQEHEKTKVDFRAYEVLEISHEMVEIDDALKVRLFQYAEHFGLPSCEFDFAEVEDGEPYFLECNPNGQWLWIEIMCKVPVSKSMALHLAEKSGHNFE